MGDRNLFAARGARQKPMVALFNLKKFNFYDFRFGKLPIILIFGIFIGILDFVYGQFLQKR